jgi:hypothetical protein
MVVCLSVKTATSQTVFQYLGNEADLWISSVKRVLSDVDQNPKGSYHVELDGQIALVCSQKLRRLRDRVRLPNYFIEIERVVQQVSCGQWNDLQIPREHFKATVKTIWNQCQSVLGLESQVLDALYREGNGGLRVESILSRLLAAGVLARFAVVRDALGHLCKLCLVERAYGQFSIREGMLNR